MSQSKEGKTYSSKLLGCGSTWFVSIKPDIDYIEAFKEGKERDWKMIGSIR